MTTLAPHDRHTLQTIRDRCEYSPVVPELADALREQLPDVDDVTLSIAVLTTVSLLKEIASAGGLLTAEVTQVVGVGGLVAAELAALEIGGDLL